MKTDKEFQEARRKALEQPDSPYREFFITHQGYEFRDKNGHRVDKWEVFGSDLSLYTRVEADPAKYEKK